jgi:phage/plasmid primase-like uncharacterized protein
MKVAAQCSNGDHLSAVSLNRYCAGTEANQPTLQ